ncbi:hypothetical protein SCLCIDRAFT_1216845 [Scleroderma citrinum Foug A]|uniref:Uncharacterized protein n=1 Tax=Scleroderma citrinum Foug A TaxID=1036808 RepID=A0A0C2ZF98_9AGAM|nr:hypothetical protein SCLCIDRAFT_1216845 [Scleroderma citrinum Foug A]
MQKVEHGDPSDSVELQGWSVQLQVHLLVVSTTSVPVQSRRSNCRALSPVLFATGPPLTQQLRRIGVCDNPTRCPTFLRQLCLTALDASMEVSQVHT